MLKLIKFVNERGGKAQIPAIEKPPVDFNHLENVFELLLEHEISVTESINQLVDICLQEKDYTTHNFVQWYVSEQLEEEALARSVLDKLRLIGGDKGGMYMFDRDLETAAVSTNAATNP
jgi:ferritin